MTLEVIGAGFGRTGTLSMKKALEELGYRKTHHMNDVLTNPKQVELWHEVGLGKPPQWDRIFDGYMACVDFPSATYYRELLAHYPDAKVVLTVRDFDRWYESASNTIFRMTQVGPSWLNLVPAARTAREMTDATVWDRVFAGRFADRKYTRQVFHDYIDNVKASVPPDRLLVFEVKQGWEPLCAFLDKPVPQTMFPHANDTKSFQNKVRAVQALHAAPVLAAGVLAAGVRAFARR